MLAAPEKGITASNLVCCRNPSSINGVRCPNDNGHDASSFSHASKSSRRHVAVMRQQLSCTSARSVFANALLEITRATRHVIVRSDGSCIAVYNVRRKGLCSATIADEISTNVDHYVVRYFCGRTYRSCRRRTDRYFPYTSAVGIQWAAWTRLKL